VPGANINPYTNLTGAVSFFFHYCVFTIFLLKFKFSKNWRYLPLDKGRTFWKAHKTWKKIFFLVVWMFTKKMYKAWERLHNFLCASQKVWTLINWPS
jgi:hypothetical protein